MSRPTPYIALLVVALAAGCSSDRATGPEAAGDDWSLVRFHESTASGYRDLTVQPDGSLWLEDGRTGDESSARGLLAGERLETLARLIDDLPRRSYAPQDECGEDGFFVSLTRSGEVMTFASNSCDDQMPAALGSVQELLSSVVAEVREPRLQTVGFTVLAEGEYSNIREPRRVVVESRNGLVQLLQQHDPSHAVALPQVDFRKQIVIARFLGQKPSGGNDVALEYVERTDTGWLSLHYLEETPGPCTVSALPTQPYVIVAVERPEGGLLFESKVVESRCD
ncbi:MAG: protease complex subunit PrcB family protein [Candidatus Eisenbacteria bacterium]|uniref:Protease complex subunit PrcB family protein n=1 Tax=Eiseniibacteriota bacterium TaxID=2212470 RepID=A0A956M2S5_UNCEI|nr:protease complex subunit PrcB family protein [Candidatus Eisenbacteria bacterium]